MRINLALQKLEEKGLECGIVLKPENIYYLTEVFPTAFAVLLLKEEPLLYLSKMDTHLVSKCKIDVDIIENFKKIHIPFKKIGVEESYMSYKFYRKKLHGKKIENLDFIDEMRKIKDDKEIKKIKKSLKIAEKCMKEIIDLDMEGKSEKEVSAQISKCIKEKAELAFLPIVASGKNSAIPHHSPTNKRIKKKDAVIIDLGARVGYYNSDITRTICSSPDEKFLEVYSIVVECQKAAIEECYVGNKIKNIDIKAREIFGEYNLEDYFLHSCGHGIGLEVHEPPKISKNSEGVLEKNMVITVEPGIYKEFGIRIEDMILVDKKPKILSKLRKLP